jgi:hypothetical protein
LLRKAIDIDRGLAPPWHHHFFHTRPLTTIKVS